MLQLKDCFEDRFNFYVVTDFIPSGDLHRYVSVNFKQTPMPEAIVKDILRQLVVTIKELHRRHIMHRDIKEANVLVTGEGS